MVLPLLFGLFAQGSDYTPEKLYGIAGEAAYRQGASPSVVRLNELMFQAGETPRTQSEAVELRRLSTTLLLRLLAQDFPMVGRYGSPGIAAAWQDGFVWAEPLPRENYAGDTISSRWVLINNQGSTRIITVRWEVEAGTRKLLSSTKLVLLFGNWGGGEFRFRLPPFAKKQSVKVKCSSWERGKRLFSAQTVLSVFPRPKTAAVFPVATGLIPPEKRERLWVIGENQLPSSLSATQLEQLREFCEAGGKVLILEQRSLAAILNLLACKGETGPCLRGFVEPSWKSFFGQAAGGSGALFSRGVCAKTSPLLDGARLEPVIVGADFEGNLGALLAFRAIGKGELWTSQLSLKSLSEVTRDRLLTAVLQAISRRRESSGAALGIGSQAGEILRKIGFPRSATTDDLKLPETFDGIGALVMDGTAATINSVFSEGTLVKDFIRHGGAALVVKLDADGTLAFNRAFDTRLRLGRKPRHSAKSPGDIPLRVAFGIPIKSCGEALLGDASLGKLLESECGGCIVGKLAIGDGWVFFCQSESYELVKFLLRQLQVR